LRADLNPVESRRNVVRKLQICGRLIGILQNIRAVPEPVAINDRIRRPLELNSINVRPAELVSDRLVDSIEDVSGANREIPRIAL
jgi:hypothetical protein